MVGLAVLAVCVLPSQAVSFIAAISMRMLSIALLLSGDYPDVQQAQPQQQQRRRRWRRRWRRLWQQLQLQSQLHLQLGGWGGGGQRLQFERTQRRQLLKRDLSLAPSLSSGQPVASLAFPPPESSRPGLVSSVSPKIYKA